MIYSLGDTSDMAIAQKWSNIEGFVSMIVVATPGIWPFIRRIPFFGGRSSYYNSDQAANSTGSRKHRSIAPGNINYTVDSHENHFEMFRGARRSNKRRASDVDSEAQHIFDKDGNSDHTKTSNAPISIAITTEYLVEHEDGTGSDLDLKKTGTMLS